MAKDVIATPKKPLNYGQNVRKKDAELLGILASVEKQRKEAAKKRQELITSGRGARSFRGGRRGRPGGLHEARGGNNDYDSLHDGEESQTG